MSLQPILALVERLRSDTLYAADGFQTLAILETVHTAAGKLLPVNCSHMSQ